MFRAPRNVWLCWSRGDLDMSPARLLLLLVMAKTDPRVDAYIANAAPFAQPILMHLRRVVHAGCPGVRETIKWQMPHFDYKGLFIGMAAFKQHCSFGFWREAALALGGNGEDADGMGQFGRITSLKDLPPEKTLVGYVRRAAEIKDAGVKKPVTNKKRQSKATPLREPDYFGTALKLNPKARATWAKLSTSHRNEYVEWLTDAKREETREKRLATTLEWLAEGKPRNWKHQAK